MRQKFLVVLALVLVTVAAHWRVLQNDFVNYDDNDYVTANPIVQRGVTAEGLAWAFGNLHGAKTYWHPLPWVSHMIDCQLFKLKPAGHHAMSLLLHAVNVVLLFLVLERLTGARWRSVIVAALWAVHPLQVDTVAWVTERKNILAAFFWLLTMAAYARYAAKPTVGRYLLVPLAMALGLMCKPVLVTLPFALLLLDGWPMRRWRGRGAGQGTEERRASLGQNPPPAEPSDARRSGFPTVPVRRLLLEKLPLLALAIISAVITQLAHDRLGVREEITGLQLHHKIGNALVAYVRYIDHTLWPADLTVLYLHPGAWPAAKVALCGAMLAVITTLALVQVRRQPWLLIGWCWFLGVLVPTIGLRQAGIQAMADRFAYLPLIGLLVMVVWSVADRLAGSARAVKASSGLVAIALVALTAVTWKQTGHWKNSVTLWTRAIAINPNNYLAHANLAVELMGQSKFPDARRHAEEAARIFPAFVEPRLTLAWVAWRTGDTAEMRRQIEQGARARPGGWEVVRRAGGLWAAEGALEPALAVFDLGLMALPADADLRAQRAQVLDAMQRPREAAQEYREVLRLQPDAPLVQNNLARLLATAADPALRNGAEAVRLAERACELTGRRHAIFLGTLAAAYAEAGRFPDAVRSAEQAIAVAGAAGEKQVAELNRQLVELYRAGKPYRQAAQK